MLRCVTDTVDLEHASNLERFLCFVEIGCRVQSSFDGLLIRVDWTTGLELQFSVDLK